MAIYICITDLLCSVDQTWLICSRVDCSPAGSSSLSMGFSRQEYWSGLPFPSPRIEERLYQTLHEWEINLCRIKPMMTYWRSLTQWLKLITIIMTNSNPVKSKILGTVYKALWVMVYTKLTFILWLSDKYSVAIR